MDVLIEILLEVYMELMFLLVPEKNITKKHKAIAVLLAVTVLVIVFALAIWGLTLIIEKGNWLGAIPLAVAIIISLAQIIAGMLLYKKNH